MVTALKAGHSLPEVDELSKLLLPEDRHDVYILGFDELAGHYSMRPESFHALFFPESQLDFLVDRWEPESGSLEDVALSHLRNLTPIDLASQIKLVRLSLLEEALKFADAHPDVLSSIKEPLTSRAVAAHLMDEKRKNTPIGFLETLGSDQEREALLLLAAQDVIDIAKTRLGEVKYESQKSDYLCREVMPRLRN